MQDLCQRVSQGVRGMAVRAALTVRSVARQAKQDGCRLSVESLRRVDQRVLFKAKRGEFNKVCGRTKRRLFGSPGGCIEALNSLIGRYRPLFGMKSSGPPSPETCPII